LISNHAFVDGNKRIGVYVMLSFLEMNGIRLQCTDDELVDIGLSVASSRMRYEELLQWVLDHKA
jgi:death-on-curing protein